APGDITVNDNERRARGFLLRYPDGVIEDVEIVGVADTLNVPMVRHETRCHIVAESECRVAFDSDAIIVVDPDQLVQLEVAGQRGRFLRDAFHQIAVTANGVDSVVDDLVTGTIEVSGQPRLS